MVGEMAQQRSAVPGDQDTAFALRPEEDLSVGGALGKVSGVADAHHGQGIRAALIVPADRVPELAPQVLIQEESDVHGSGTLRLPLGFQSAFQFRQTWSPLRSSRLALDFRPCLLDVPLDLVLVLQVKRNDLVDQGQGQRRVGRGKGFGRAAILVVLDDVLQRDPMPSQEYLSGLVATQEIGQRHE